MLTNRLTSTLKIQASETHMAALVAMLFAMVELSRSIGGSAADALFFHRFGVEFLPYLYIALGLTTFVASLSYAAFLGRLHKGRFFFALMAVMALVLLVERAAIVFELRWLYPLLWLSVNIIGALLGTIAWNTAGEVCDTRQAKRLFPLFVSAGILGGLSGSLIIGPLARLLGTENLIVIGALLLALAALVIRALARRYFPPAGKPTDQSSFLADIRIGFDYVRASPLLQRLAVSAVLFSILYFSISFPFGRAVSAAFSSEAELAGFLGLFNGITGTVMFVAALLVANRLYARIGIALALLLLPVTYLLGFVLFAVNFSFSTAVVVRLSQLVVLGGIGDGAYSAFFNVIPAERRAQVRAFDAGVPAQIGTMLSGILLILGERILNNTQIFMMGMIGALLCTYVVWQMRWSYVDALAAALRAGRVEVFTTSDRIFAGFQGDTNALRVALAALDDKKATARRLAADILARMGAVTVVRALIAHIHDESADVRMAIIRALGELGATEAVASVIALLQDPSPPVRVAALEVLPRLHPQACSDEVRPLLEDTDPTVQVQALVALARCGDPDLALQMLTDALYPAFDEHSVTVLRALEIALPLCTEVPDRTVNAIVQCLDASSVAVRGAACRTLGNVTHDQALSGLIGRLSDPDRTVRLTAAHSLRALGTRATSDLLTILQTQDQADHDAVLTALAGDDPLLLKSLRDYAEQERQRLRHWRELRRALPEVGPVTRLLASVLEEKVALSEGRLIRVIGFFGHDDMMDLVARSFLVRDEQTRATAVEALDTLGDKELVRALLPLLEETASPDHRGSPTTRQAEVMIRQLLAEEDPWLRALAAGAAGEMDIRTVIPDLRQLAVADGLIGDATRDALVQLGETMETLPTMSLMERIVLLKDVPLFSDLSPDDLKQIAEIATERWLPDGVVLVEEGDEGHELFIIASGNVRVTKRTGEGEKLLAIRTVGDFIGEMAIIDSVARFATVRAEGEARVLGIHGDTFKAILRDRPEVSLAVLRGLSRRLRERE